MAVDSHNAHAVAQYANSWSTLPRGPARVEQRGKKLNLAFENSPSTIPGALIEYDGDILDHRHQNLRPGEDFQTRDKKTGGVRITRVYRGSGKFSLQEDMDESELDMRRDPATISALGSPRTDLSRLSNVSEGFDVKGHNSLRWEETTTEQNIESMRKSMEAAALRKAKKSREKKESMETPDGSVAASYMSGKKSRRKNKKSRSGSQLFGRESMKSNNSERVSAPISPFMGDMANGGAKFTPRSSGKFSTPSGSFKNSSMRSSSMKTDATGRDSFASVKTELLESTGYNSPLSSPHERALALNDMINAKMNSDAKRHSIPSLEDDHGDKKEDSAKYESDMHDHHDQVSIRKPPRKPPKPKRLLDKHNSGLQTLREDGQDDDKESDDRMRNVGAKPLSGEDGVVDVRNYDSTKSNISEFPNLLGQRLHSVDPKNDALATARSAEKGIRDEEMMKEGGEEKERAEQRHRNKEEEIERRQKEKEADRLRHEQERAAEILGQGELEADTEKKRKQQQRDRREARLKERERRRRRQNRAIDSDAEVRKRSG